MKTWLHFFNRDGDTECRAKAIELMGMRKWKQ